MITLYTKAPQLRKLIKSMGSDQREACWWADRVERDASQALPDLATEHLGKCGQTDESRLGAPPPKGRRGYAEIPLG
ncbi:hypothetical protein EYF80_041265 [Liparis tanakae]|uniref:Uncharacterized protein n=1 Tax=Liparis tanakae TaxID=230148 RepID=A0A4Z2G5K3_9TELE|nr:hypothetical protein EYF80_041265 [Liparis tanakae]